MLPLSRALADTRAALDSGGIDEADRCAAWLVEAATGTTRTDRIVRPDRPVSADEQARLAAMLARRLAGEPVQYVTGEAAFRRLTLAVGPGVLVPRPETEDLAEIALDELRRRAAPDASAARVLDAGTGSGCIALAVKDEHPAATVHALDVSEAALVVARANAHRLGLGVAFHRADLLAEALPEAVRQSGPFDVLVSNPPYIPDADAPTLAREVALHEPALALFSGPDALVFYRALARHAEALVRPGGLVALETDDAHAHAAAACFAPEVFSGVQVRADLYGRDRFLVARRR